MPRQPCPTIRLQYFDKRRPDYEDTLRPDDHERGRYVLDRADDSQQTYDPALFEGDMANPGLSADTIGYFINDPQQVALSDPLGLQRNAVNSAYLLWPDRRVPYTISSQYSSYSRARIASAMDEYAKQTCVQFVPRQSDDPNYVHIFPDSGCYSMVGKNGGRQEVSLGTGCVSKGIIMHELMHAVGFFHEQSRTDRDNYIDVLWDNIRRGLTGQFSKYSSRRITSLGTSYDYGSIMHYGARAFSSNGEPTIQPKQSSAVIGQRNGFSSTDSFKINKLYSCDGPSGVVTAPFYSTQQPFTTRPFFTTQRPFTTRPPFTSSGCTDNRSDCSFLQNSLNWCVGTPAQSSFMARECKRTCNKCTTAGPVFPTSRPTSGLCADKRSYCTTWARLNLCNGTYSKFMRLNCARSCSFC